MKRIAMVLVIAMLAIASVFSASSNVVNTTEAKVSFNLKPEHIAAYASGFTTQANLNGNQTWNSDAGADMTDIPVKETDITLAFNKQDFVGYNNDYFIFYKARGVQNIKLELSATPLKDGKKTINYTVKVGSDNNLVDTNGPQSWTSSSISMDPSTNFKAGTYPLQITTYKVNATDIGNYTSTMTLKITTL